MKRIALGGYYMVGDGSERLFFSSLFVWWSYWYCGYGHSIVASLTKENYK